MKKLFLAITIFALGLVGAPAQVFATNNYTQFGEALGENGANILKGCAKESGEKSITCILELVVDILTIGIGILGVIGISVVGVQYLTAGGNEEQTRKAKRRMFEIVIGLVAYAVLYAILKFLLPGKE